MSNYNFVQKVCVKFDLNLFLIFSGTDDVLGGNLDRQSNVANQMLVCVSAVHSDQQ